MRQILLYIFILFVCSVSAEQFMITGTVVDARDSLQCIGASVMVVGTNRGTATDGDGNFSIEVEKGEILKFSYYGYNSKEVEVLNNSSLIIELEEDEELSGFDNCPVICLCERIRRDPGRYRFVPIERDSLKRAPKN